MSGFSDRGVVGFTMLQTLVFPSCSHWGSGKGKFLGKTLRSMRACLLSNSLSSTEDDTSAGTLMQVA